MYNTIYGKNEFYVIHMAVSYIHIVLYNTPVRLNMALMYNYLHFSLDKMGFLSHHSKESGNYVDFLISTILRACLDEEICKRPIKTDI